MRVFLLSMLMLISPLARGQRLVSTSPQLTELLFQLGLGAEIVASPDFSWYPEQAKAIPSLGPLFQPSIERTLTVNPQLVLLDGTNKNLLYEASLKHIGIPSLKLTMDNWEALRSSISKIFERLNRPIPEKLKGADSCVNQYRTEKSFTFLLLVWADPPIAASQSTFLSDLFTRLGGRNLIPEKWQGNFIQISREWLYANPPERLLVLEDFGDLSKRVKELSESCWPENHVDMQVLPGASFARANFTPFIAASSLQWLEPRPRWKECFSED